MEQFFSNPAPQHVDEEQLVELVAIRTRNLADEIREFFVGPHFLVSARFDGIGQNLISVVRKPWSYNEEDAKVIGDLGDKNIFEKVKAAYEELARNNAVAEGPEKA